jgi:diadenosine tetraphosphatase ApaH/serine/threonine PP2A family protein phosphatase
MIAILSDIHANLAALEAVLWDVEQFDVEAIYCLGDIIGDGPDAITCLRHAMTWPVVLLGNFDEAALGTDDLPGWITAVHARQTILRFRSELAQHADCATMSAFLSALPSHVLSPDALFVHGSPRSHVTEYLYPEDIYNERKMTAIASHFDSLCFCGHTHIPGVFRSAAPVWDYISPEECNYEYPVAKDKLICNVGSVGQPRDGDPRACYVLFAPDRIVFRRVDYDVDRTIQKMRDNGDDDMHSERLRSGR